MLRRGLFTAVLLVVTACSDPPRPCGGTCPSGEECVDDRCQRLCNRHSDCAATQHCERGSCVAGAVGSASSSGGSSSSAAPAMCGGNFQVFGCGTCPSGMTCRAGTCVSACEDVRDCTGEGAACGDGCYDARTECTDVDGTGLCGLVDTRCTALVPLADTRPTDAGGVREIPDDRVCNPGPDVSGPDGGVLYAGGRLCDRYPGLAFPPPVMCVGAGAAGLPPYVGYCRATCIVPSFTRAEETTYSCPPESPDCALDLFIYRSYRPDGGTVSCTSSNDCPGDNARCVDLGAGRVCAFPFGFCQPR